MKSGIKISDFISFIQDLILKIFIPLYFSFIIHNS